MKTKIRYLLLIAALLSVMFVMAAPVSAETATVHIGGVVMEDGDYLALDSKEVTDTKPSGAYAYYSDGVMTLHDFTVAPVEAGCTGIYSEGDLDICLEGNSTIDVSGAANGIYVLGNLDIYCDGGDATLTIDSDYGAIYAEGNLYVNTVYIEAASSQDTVIFAEGDVTILYGALNLSTPDGNGLYSEGDITAEGASLIIESDNTAIYCEGDMEIDAGEYDICSEEYNCIYAYGTIDIVRGGFCLDSGYSCIACNSNINISGGTFEMYSATGDGIFSYEGNIDIAGGNFTIDTSDAGILGNAIEISGGNIYCSSEIGMYALGSDITIEGGEIYLDTEYFGMATDMGSIYVTGGLVVAISGTDDDDEGCAVLTENLSVSSSLTVKASRSPGGQLDAYSKSNLYNYDYIVICKALKAPTNVKVNNVTSSGKPKVTWTAVSGADKYYVYRATSKNGSYSYLGSTTNTHYTNTGATAGKTYYYKVRAVKSSDELKNSVLSSSCYITCDLAQPTNVKVNPVASSGKPKVTWNSVSGANRYYIYRATSKDGTYSYLGSTTNTSYTNTGAKAGTTYYYKVKAVISENSAGNSALSSSCYMTCDLAKPAGVKVTLSSGKPKVSWTAVSGAKKYYVYRATSPDGTYSYMGYTSGTSYTNKSAKAGTKYYYKVKAVISESSAANSALSSYVSITSK